MRRFLLAALSIALLVSTFAVPVSASSRFTWDFSNTNDYTYNANEIELVNGLARLKDMGDNTFSEAAEIVTKTGLAYTDLIGFWADMTGEVRFQVSKNGATWYALEPEGQGWRVYTSTAPEDTDSASDLNLVIPTFFDEFGEGDLFVKAVLYASGNGLAQPTLSGMTVEYEGEPEPETTCFADVPLNHVDYTAICELKTRGIVSGVDATSFFPNSTVRRGEAFKIALAGRDVSTFAFAENPFVDLPDNHTLKPWILYLYHNGVISGYDATHVGPDSSLTEAEAAKVILNLNGISAADSPSGDTYGLPASSSLVPYVHTAFFLNLYRGGRPAYEPNRGMTRGKIATMMYRVLIMNENQWSVYQE